MMVGMTPAQMLWDQGMLGVQKVRQVILFILGVQVPGFMKGQRLGLNIITVVNTGEASLMVKILYWF
jgi:hypothetical protein